MLFDLHADPAQRQAMRDAAEIAGIEAVRLLNEPTAVALAYGYAQAASRQLVVVDFGGGTLDVTVMRIAKGRLETLATSGDILLGGSDVDRAVAQLFAGEIGMQTGFDPNCDAVALQRLVSAAERAKQQLTSADSAEISLPFLAEGEAGQPVLHHHVFGPGRPQGAAELRDGLHVQSAEVRQVRHRGLVDALPEIRDE